MNWSPMPPPNAGIFYYRKVELLSSGEPVYHYSRKNVFLNDRGITVIKDSDGETIDTAELIFGEWSEEVQREGIEND